MSEGARRIVGSDSLPVPLPLHRFLRGGLLKDENAKPWKDLGDRALTVPGQKKAISKDKAGILLISLDLRPDSVRSSAL